MAVATLKHLKSFEYASTRIETANAHRKGIRP